MSETPTLRPAESDDLDAIETLLASHELPVADLGEVVDSLFVYELDGEPIGVGGVERYGRVGLLRSVAIEPAHQGSGYGRELCLELLERARAADTTELYLLTTTAEGFFARIGFERIERADVPTPIRETSEFSELCPASAVCMTRRLERPD